MKTECEVKKGNDTVRWIKSLFTNPDATIQCGTAETGDAPSAKPQSVPRNGKTVLVVDDDSVFLKAASMRLQSEGYDVITASEGSEAIQVARRKRPDILVLDIELTRDVAGVPWDGFSVISWLRRFDDLKNIPVVIATAGDPVRYTKKAFSSGASAVFHKRMDPQHLITLISRSLRLPRLATTGAGLDTNFQI